MLKMTRLCVRVTVIWSDMLRKCSKKVSRFCIRLQEHTKTNPPLSPHLRSLTGPLEVSHSWGAKMLVCIMMSW